MDELGFVAASRKILRAVSLVALPWLTMLIVKQISLFREKISCPHPGRIGVREVVMLRKRKEPKRKSIALSLMRDVQGSAA